MRFRIGLVAAALGLAGALACAAQDSAPAPDPASLAPRDALLWVGVTDLSDVLDAYERTSTSKLMNDPAASKALVDIGMVKHLLDGLKKRLASSLDLAPEQLKNPFDGPVSFFVRPTGDKDEKLRPAIVLGIGDRDSLVSYYERLRSRLRDRVDEFERITFDEFDIDSYRQQGDGKSGADADSDEDGATADPNETDPFGMDENEIERQVETWLAEILSEKSIPKRLAVCLGERYFIVAQSVEEVKDILRLQRGGESLRDTEGYKALEREFKQPGRVRMLANIPGLLELNREDADAVKQLAALGLDRLGCAVAHGDCGADGVDQTFDVFLPVQGERTGLAKIFSQPSMPTAPTGRIPPDAFIFARANINPGELVNEIESITRRIDPEAADELRTSLEAIPLSETETFNLRRDVIDRLRAPATLTFSFARPLGPDSARVLLSIGHAGKDAIVRAIEALRGLAPGMLIDRDLRGTPVYDIPLGGVSLAAAADRVVLGVTPAVESELQEVEGGRGLGDDPLFRRALAAVDQEAWLVVWVNERSLFELAVELAARGEHMPPASPVAFLTQSLAGNSIKSGAAEDARGLLRYKTGTLMTVRTTPDGLHVRAVQLAPTP